MRADRLLSMMLLLHAKGRMTAEDLAGSLEVSERTIYRDIEALSIAGIPIYTQTGTNGGIFLDENYRISLTGLSAPEVKSLFLATVSQPLADLGLGGAVEDTLLKLFAALPSRQQDEAQRMQQRFYIDTANWFQIVEPSSYLPLLEKAVWENRCLSVRYQPLDGHFENLALEAYALVAKVNIWYLVGRKVNGEWRNYRLSRFHAVEVLEPFERDKDFDLVSYWRESCKLFESNMVETSPPYKVYLRVHPKAFWYFPSWMAGRYQQEDPDAEGWTALHVSYESRSEALRYLSGLGAFLEILEPADFREELIRQARAILAFYTDAENQEGEF
jgi:predicted DNA-binding transcriptional regulator YafY